MVRQWDTSDFENRTSGGQNLEGFEPCSPNDAEIQMYKSFAEDVLTDPFSDAPALVMGMTVRVRKAMHEIGCQVTCLDISQDAIDYLTSAVPANFASSETVLNGDWMDMPTFMPEGADVVVGDFVFANVLSLADHRSLLKRIYDTLRPTGAFVTRAFVVPKEFNWDQYLPERAIAAYRSGKMSEGEFTLGMRLFGFMHRAYNPKSQLIDNQVVLTCLKEHLEGGVLSQEEFNAVSRNFFGGHTFLTHKESWEEMLDETGFAFETADLSGKAWYQYSYVYKCTRR